MNETKLECQYCGQNPVPHGLTWFNESLMVIFTPINRWMTQRWFYNYADQIVSSALVILARTLHAARVIRFNQNREDLKIDRAKVLWAEAEKRNFEMQSGLFLNKPVDFYRVRFPGRGWFYFNGLPRPGSGGAALAWMDDKNILKEKLAAAHIPVPKGRSCTTFDQAVAVWQSLGRPVIVKPRLGSRGRHSFTNINSIKDLRAAFFLAKQLCHWVMVEEYLPGTLYRGTMIAGRLAGAMGWTPPQVTGNGQATVARLIEIKNNTRPQGVGAVKINDDLENYIGRAGLKLDSVVPAEQTVVLGPKIGPHYGGTSLEITDILHPQIKDVLESAAAVVDDPIIGFDFIILDPTQPPAGQHWGIIEANALPFIHFHHHPISGTPKNIAGHIWDLFPGGQKP